MIQRILVPIGGSALPFDGATAAFKLAKQLVAAVAVCLVSPPYTMHFSRSLSRVEQQRADDDHANAKRSAEIAFAPVIKPAADSRIKCESHLLMIGIGYHGRGAIGRSRLGRAITKVLALSKLALAIFPWRVPSERAIRTVR
jgi:nucleotide-binding universal stress UspA family protein